VQSDSNPGFELPLGYAGGLWDGSTGLIRFGFRDYDPQAGRWTTRDPTLYAGGQVNLYAYVGNDPVNRRDPNGLFCVGATGYAGAGGGGRICTTKEGVSVCFEVGFGVGGGVDISPAGDLDKTDQSVKAELMAGCFDVGVGGQCKLDGCGNFKCKDKDKAGPFRSDGTKEGTSVRLGKIGSGLKKGPCEVSGKIAAEKCVKF
jgi:RHS repeat-associated protein